MRLGRRTARPITDASRVVAYSRVSTQEQADSHAGLDAQRAAIVASCAARGWTLVEFFEDAAVSGQSTANRPQLVAALDALESGAADVLMVSKLDRLSRSLRDFIDVLDRATREGWRLVILDLDIDAAEQLNKLATATPGQVRAFEHAYDAFHRLGTREDEPMTETPADPATAVDVETAAEAEQAEGTFTEGTAADPATAVDVETATEAEQAEGTFTEGTAADPATAVDVPTGHPPGRPTRDAVETPTQQAQSGVNIVEAVKRLGAARAVRTAGGAKMPNSDPQAVVAASDKAYEARDVDGVMALYADDIVVRAPGGIRAESKEAVRDLVARIFSAYRENQMELLRRFVDGEYVISEWRAVSVHTGELTLATGEHVPPTRKTITQESVIINHVVNGKILEETSYFDRHAFLQQIGQIPRSTHAG
jgi:steroid delta-isomerase-like uncharacterized protein